jgi:hypothetical protein
MAGGACATLSGMFFEDRTDNSFSRPVKRKAMTRALKEQEK